MLLFHFGAQERTFLSKLEWTNVRKERKAGYLAVKRLGEVVSRKKKKPPRRLSAMTWCFGGGPARIRTENQRIMSPLLHR